MTPAEILAQDEHRPWPLPSKPWLMRQQWSRLLFAHWPLDLAAIRPLVPPILELDVRDDRAWVAVTPFFLSGLSLRRLPPIPGISSFPELNVRTYVRYQGKPGVYFFSLDAGSVAAVFGARAMYGLPYIYATMRIRVNRTANSVHYDCLRRHRGKEAGFRGEYRPCGPQFQALPGSLEQFLVERYCLYSVVARRLYRAEIHHIPWPLQPAVADISLNTMTRPAGIDLPNDRPLLHYADKLDVLVWWPERLL
ncbi:MAG: YqjF family protein [Terriglobales bacterium]